MNRASRRIAIVTGANHGIGFETSVGLAEAGFHVVMACRSNTKAEQARASIIERSPQASLEVMQLDLSDFESVRSFAERFHTAYPQLDVLINNAGILSMTPKTNADGIELQFATNHLGHFLLTQRLISAFPDDAASRIVHLSSLAHKSGRIDFDDLTCAGDGLAAYGQSKLACLLFGEELDRRLRSRHSAIRSVTVHPGGSDSGLFDEMSRWQYYAFKLVAPLLMNSQAAAAQPSLFAALDPTATGGAYYGPQGFREFRGRVGQATREPATQDVELAQRLWELSEELTGERFSLEEMTDV